ncbi:TonB-dependent receptor domain-containing protein, partial [Porphyromonas catoniae]|uniref:TonB-dependent receptor family protein n=1 Tax=Porphyromonas catoniae TaxID=41976 RepID=UPI0028CFFDBC
MYHTAGRLALALSISLLGLEAMAQTSATDSISESRDSVRHISEVVVYARQMLGSKFEARNRTGSAYYLSPKELAKFGYTDISRMLRAVPGVNIYEEDGYGLRPNISLRGTKAERSERISLMEDGILAAPAPYAAPAAYYFPNAARMHAIEVLKGSSQVQYGPFTTGGAVNMVSTPIPKTFHAGLRSSYGSYGTFNSYTHVGNDHKHIGYLIEYLRYQSKGFKKDEPNERTGFYRNDVVGKLRLHSDEGVETRQALELKLGFANEHSDESYVGLSEQDFASRPYYRYRGAQMDNLRTRHVQTALTHLVDFTGGMKVTTSVYYNYFWRNWYKLNDVRVGDQKGEKRTIEEVLADPETNARYLDLLTGATNRLGEALLVRANQRTYHSRGIQTKVEYRLPFLSSYLQLEAGARYHADVEDRFQHDDSYSIEGGKMSLFRAGLPGSQSNRITTAHAFASYLLGKWTRAGWTIIAGLRLEDVELYKRDYTTQDPRRTGHLRIEGSNHATALLPSLGINYRILRPLSIFAGVHQGFAPPSVMTYYKQKPEKSINL